MTCRPRWAWASAPTLAFLPLAPALAQAQQRLGGGEALGVSLGRIVSALLICIMVALLAVLLIRQRGGKMDLPALFGKLELKPRLIQVVETRRLSPHADICLVRQGGQEYLLLLLAGSASVLRKQPVATDAAEEA